MSERDKIERKMRQIPLSFRESLDESFRRDQKGEISSKSHADTSCKSTQRPLPLHSEECRIGRRMVKTTGKVILQKEWSSERWKVMSYIHR